MQQNQARRARNSIAKAEGLGGDGQIVPAALKGRDSIPRISRVKAECIAALQAADARADRNPGLRPSLVNRRPVGPQQNQARRARNSIAKAEGLGGDGQIVPAALKGRDSIPRISRVKAECIAALQAAECACRSQTRATPFAGESPARWAGHPISLDGSSKSPMRVFGTDD
ncbi:MAG: hypothetical protein DCC45_11800 [Armatimonadetes bacterium]|nr:MAG: hypothetical protein DCC45_11800 [Armatimonadota bacterium]